MTLQELSLKIGYSLNPSEWTQHPNGGGWVYKDAKVHADAYLGEKAVVRGGTIEGGTIWGGTIRGGTIEGGTIWGGTIRGGTIRGGTIEGGTIWGGTIEGGTIEGGTIEGGTIWGGTIEGGTIWGGTIEGGTIRGGTIWGGTIRGGTIQDGEWNTTPLFITGSKHSLSNAKPGHIQIGCKCETYSWWLSKEGTRFALENGYTRTEINEYRAYVGVFAKWGRPAEKEKPATKKPRTRKAKVATV